MTPHALVSSLSLPEYDRDGGSTRVFNLLKLLRQMDWHVTFIPAQAEAESRYSHLLQQLGIATYTENKYYLHPENILSIARFDLAICHFWSVAEHWIPLLRRHSPQTRIIVDTIDIHFLREAREAFYQSSINNRSERINADYALRMTRELNTYASADAVLTVSHKEADLIRDFLSGSVAVHFVPDYEDLEPSQLGYEQRRGLVFLGSFRYPPNQNAVHYLCQDIVPFISASLLEQDPIFIIGSDLSNAVANYAIGLANVRLIGWVPSVFPYLGRARASVIPLQYGAGTKRKVIQSILIGTPVVTTNIGAEGLDLVDGETALIADEPAAFAHAVERLVTDPILWEKLSRQGREHLLQTHGINYTRTTFRTMISSVVQ